MPAESVPHGNDEVVPVEGQPDPYVQAVKLDAWFAAIEEKQAQGERPHENPEKIMKDGSIPTGQAHPDKIIRDMIQKRQDGVQ